MISLTLKQSWRRTLVSAVFVSGCSLTSVQAQWHRNPNATTETLKYWQKKALAEDANAGTVLAHQVFARLLATWDSPRLPPRFAVVDAGKTIWAASLDDGAIVLSRAAVNLIVDADAQRASARMAFVVAHELAHQRADHLWEKRFFRLSEQDGAASPRDNLTATNEASNRLDKEHQADADAVVLMALVGYDPRLVVADDAFFLQWVQQARNKNCSLPGQLEIVDAACREASDRAERARENLAQIARQAILFELGGQAFVARKYENARRYFTAFGRMFPSAAVHNNLGLCHLSEALLLRDKVSPLAFPKIFPLQLSADLSLPSGEALRGQSDDIVQQRTQFKRHVEQAILAFEHAAQINPQDSQYEEHLIFAHLIAGNVPMATGVLEGRYRERFSQGHGYHLLAGLIDAGAARYSDAREKLGELARELRQLSRPLDAGELRALYAAYANLSDLLTHDGRRREASQAWRDLAAWAKKNHQPLLFHVAVQQVQNTVVTPTSVNVLRVVDEVIGEKMSPVRLRERKAADASIWLDGDILHLNTFDDGARVVVDGAGIVLAAWRAIDNVSAGAADMFDRLIKRYGVPDRYIHSSVGYYLAYDRLRAGFYVVPSGSTTVFAFERER